MRSLLRYVGFLMVALVIAGCSHNMERVTLPPEAPVEGVRSIAVVGVDNFTVDPGLGRQFADIVASILRESDRYTLIDESTARAALSRMGATLNDLGDTNVAKRLGRELGADALISGSATYYFEDTRLSIPRCVNCGTKNATPYWNVTHITSVIGNVQTRVIESRSGTVVWSNTVEGRDTTNRTLFLNWNSTEPPPSSLIPETDRSDIPTTRDAAIREAARLFTADLLPRHVWVRKD